MKRVLNLCVCVLLCSSVWAVGQEKPSGNSVVAQKYLKVINKPDSVSVFLIDPWVEDAQDWMDGYGEVLAKTKVTDKETVCAMQSLLTDPESFEKHDIVKNCAHMPDVVWVFHSKKGDVKCSYSVYCDVVRFAQDDDYEEFDSEQIRLKFLEVVKMAYPKDRYVRYLLKREKSLKK